MDNQARMHAQPIIQRDTHISLLFDLGASPEPTDIARDKDQMLAEVMWAEHVRKTARKNGRPRQRARLAAGRR